MVKVTHTLLNSNLANQRQHEASETSSGLSSTSNERLTCEVGLSNSANTRPVKNNIEQLPTLRASTSSIRFFDASDISTAKSDNGRKTDSTICKEVTAKLNDHKDLPRAKTVILHKVAPSDTFPGISLKYGIEVGVIRRVNKLWFGDPLQICYEIKIPLQYCTITNAELDVLKVLVVSHDELDNVDVPDKGARNRLGNNLDPPNSPLSWSKINEDPREIFEPIANLVSRAVDSISKPLARKRTHAWNTLNTSLRRAKSHFTIPEHEEGIWIPLRPAGKLHIS